MYCLLPFSWMCNRHVKVSKKSKSPTRLNNLPFHLSCVHHEYSSYVSKTIFSWTLSITLGFIKSQQYAHNAKTKSAWIYIFSSMWMETHFALAAIFYESVHFWWSVHHLTRADLNPCTSITSHLRQRRNILQLHIHFKSEVEEIKLFILKNNHTLVHPSLDVISESYKEHKLYACKLHWW